MKFNKNNKEHKGTITVNCIFSSDNTHRYLIRRKYESPNRKLNKEKLVFILQNPTYADELLFDKSTMIASNIGIKKNYYEIVILNLFSRITDASSKLTKKDKLENISENNKANYKFV